jgi:hypothetical protein
MRALLVALLVAPLSVACSKQEPPPDCPRVVDHMLAVMKAGLTGHGDMEVASKSALIAQCESKKMTIEQRRCLLRAKDLTALANCNTPK